ncbi:hypothetical protein [Mesonia sp.]|uniref:hypothetical protein n=1 Tax=Mesonia sp. TaxID=1960830 RepID=UPI001775F5FA|nr:hypothetical protein [Mesonia sp.]HIB37023.1 hypothetical protein [Mesonia sp.]HIO27398.1 hypothetical protein [Flavobacteriaceae bacterium]
MKKFYKLTILLFSALLIVSCDADKVDDIDKNEPSIFFTQISETFFVEEGAENIYEVKLGLTGVYDENLAYDFEIDDASEASLGEDFQILDTDYVVESGQLITSFRIQANFEPASTEGKDVIFNLTSLENGMVQDYKTSFTLTLTKSCPLEADFTGDYAVTQLTAALPAAGVTTFGDGTIVTLSTDGTNNAFQRSFNAKFYPDLGFGNPFVDVIIELNCGNVIMVGEQSATGIGCGGSISIGPGEENSPFDAADDSVIVITYTEDDESNCGAPVQTTIQLTKQ